jgi:hypothetical protein
MASAPAAAAAVDPYADTSNVGWSLWLVPDEAAAAPLRRAIADLSALGRRRCDDPHDFPVFEPHLTVGFVPRTVPLGRVSALCDRLGSGADPLVVHWAAVEAGEIYFQTLYLRASTTPALSAMNGAFQAEFGMRYVYKPHLSLAYARVHARPDTERIQEALVAAVPQEALVDAALGALEVWDTSGPVEGWRRVHRVPLAGEG